MTPAAATATVGQSAQFAAMGHFMDGQTADVTATTGTVSGTSEITVTP